MRSRRSVEKPRSILRRRGDQPGDSEALDRIAPRRAQPPVFKKVLNIRGGAAVVVPTKRLYVQAIRGGRSLWPRKTVGRDKGAW